MNINISDIEVFAESLDIKQAAYLSGEYKAQVTLPLPHFLPPDPLPTGNPASPTQEPTEDAMAEPLDKPAPPNTDGLIRELPRIRRYARQNEETDYRFRDYLKRQLPLSNEQLDGVVQEITTEVWSKIDCLTCGNCCKTLQIVVDDKDIARLAKRLGMSTKAFAAQYVGVAEDGVKHFLSSPCSFLADDNRCTVYEDRPQACRDFPYLRDHNFRSRTLMMIESCATCPIVFNVWDRLKKRFPIPIKSTAKKRR